MTQEEFEKVIRDTKVSSLTAYSDDPVRNLLEEVYFEGYCDGYTHIQRMIAMHYDVSRDFPDYYHLDDYLATSGLCEECFDIVLKEHSGNDKAGEQQRRYIEEHNDLEEYTSTGEYEDNNNGYRWVDYKLG